MKPYLCIYHGNCADGFGAAWIVRKALGDDSVEFHAGVYQDTPPDCSGRDVIMVDFSYKNPVIQQILQECQSLLIIDHHKSAIEDLSGLLAETWDNWKDHYNGATHKGHRVFDINHSGAMLSWKFFFPELIPPKLLEHIEDRDLWKFKIKGTREIQAALFSYAYDFELWDKLMNSDPDRLLRDGIAIERKHFKDIEELIKITKRRMSISGHDVPVANLPYTMSSDAGHIMAQDEPFAACYWDTPEGRIFSLRSTDSGADVSEIAKQYGGGGHRNAAGFRVPFDHSLLKSEA